MPVLMAGVSLVVLGGTVTIDESQHRGLNLTLRQIPRKTIFSSSAISSWCDARTRSGIRRSRQNLVGRVASGNFDTATRGVIGMVFWGASLASVLWPSLRLRHRRATGDSGRPTLLLHLGSAALLFLLLVLLLLLLLLPLIIMIDAV